MKCEICERRISQAEFLITIGQPLTADIAKGIKAWKCADCGDGNVTVQLVQPMDFIMIDCEIST